eukprot:3922257-Pyramimonas_sp.AAC.1
MYVYTHIRHHASGHGMGVSSAESPEPQPSVLRSVSRARATHSEIPLGLSRFPKAPMRLSPRDGPGGPQDGPRGLQEAA